MFRINILSGRRRFYAIFLGPNADKRRDEPPRRRRSSVPGDSKSVTQREATYAFMPLIYTNR